MKKMILITFTLILFLSPNMFAQNEEADQAYINAITTQDLAQKVKLLKEYAAKWDGKGTQYENFVYSTLCLTPYQGKTPQETADYGEKALAAGGLDDITKLQVYLNVSAMYTQLGKNLDKAKNYASQIVKIATATKNKQGAEISPAQCDQLIGAGYFAQAQAQEKAKDYNGAVNSYVSAYNILKDKQIITSLKKNGKALYDAKNYSGAEKAFKIAAAVSNDFASIAFYAKSLHRGGKKAEALKAYKQAYGKDKSGEIAYNIGIILAADAKTNPVLGSEALTYLLDASFLSPANSKKAMALAESLYFTTNKDLKYNENVKEISDRTKRIEILTNTFNTKFAEKDEEDLSDDEIKEMTTILESIEKEQKAVQSLEAKQQASLAKFTELLEQTKKRLGVQ
ncbi:hypothetical protein ACFLRM_04330 [Acidobacteriota bacterium]